jgi:hypothetical protein
MKNKLIYLLYTIITIVYSNNALAQRPANDIYEKVTGGDYEISESYINMKYNPIQPDATIGGVAPSPLNLLNKVAFYTTSNFTETKPDPTKKLNSGGMKLNLYYPKLIDGSQYNATNMPLPVIVFGYGGGFTTPYDKTEKTIQKWLARKGFIVVVPEYRLGMNFYDSIVAKRTVWRAVQDIRMVIRKCKYLSTPKYCVDSTKPITYVGYSSGAFIGLHNLYFNDNVSENRPLSTTTSYPIKYKTWNKKGIITNFGGDIGTLVIPKTDGVIIETDALLGEKSVQDITVAISGALGDIKWIKNRAVPVPQYLYMIHHRTDGVVPYYNGPAYKKFNLFNSDYFQYPIVSGSGSINDLFNRSENVDIKPPHYKFSQVNLLCQEGEENCIKGDAGSRFGPLGVTIWHHDPPKDDAVMKSILDYIITSINNIVNNQLNLSGVPSNGHKVLLNWKAPAGNLLDLKYTIYKSIGFENNSYIYNELVSGITTTNYEVTEVEGYKDLSFKVVAKDNSGNEIVVAETVVRTLDEDPPSVVTNLTGKFDGNKIKLNWNPSTDNATAVKYEICYVTGEQDVPSTSPIPATDNNNYVFENPTLNINYKFRINSLDSNGNTNSGGEIVTVSTSSQPLAPADLKVDTEAIKALNVNQDFEGIPLTWTASQSEGVTYKLYYKSRSRDAINGSLEISAGSTEFLLPVTTCPKPMDYEFYMVAERGGFTSPKTETIFFNDSPSKPIFSFSSSNIENSLTLIWSKGKTIDKIHDWIIYKKKSIDTEYTIVKTIISDGTGGVFPLMNTVNDLDLSSIYSFKMVANDIFGNSSEYLNNFDANLGFDYCPPFSGAIPWDETTNKVSEGSFITNVLIENDVVQGPSGIYSNIFWNVYNDPVTNVSNGSNSSVLKVKVNAKDQNLNAAMIAYIDYNKNKNFEESEKITFGSLSNKANSINVPLTFISDPIIIPNDAVGKTKMRIIYQRNNTSLNIDPCSFDGIGEVEDYIVNIGSISNRQSDKFNITKDTKESIESTQQSIILFPNPVNGDILNISGVDNNLPYQIINMLGQVVETGKVENGTINVAKLPNNSYSLEIISNELRIVKRFIKL